MQLVVHLTSLSIALKALYNRCLTNAFWTNNYVQMCKAGMASLSGIETNYWGHLTFSHHLHFLFYACFSFFPSLLPFLPFSLSFPPFLIFLSLLPSSLLSFLFLSFLLSFLLPSFFHFPSLFFYSVSFQLFFVHVPIIGPSNPDGHSIVVSLRGFV